MCVCEGPGPKGFPCYACDVCLTLSLACPGSTGCKQHPNDWPLSRHRTRSFVLYPLSALPLCLSLCTLSGCTRMVSFTFYVRMLLFFELWRQEHREKEREREANRVETRTWTAVWPCAALRRCNRTVPHCAASFLELPLLTTVESVVFQRGSAWLCMGLASVPVFYSKRCHVIEFLMPACLATIKMPVITVNAPRTALNASSYGS